MSRVVVGVPMLVAVPKGSTYAFQIMAWLELVTANGSPIWPVWMNDVAGLPPE